MSQIVLTVESASLIRDEAVKLLSQAFQKEHQAGNWMWKHENNPAGQSKVVVARKHNRMVGIRPIMVSPVRCKDQDIKAVQFVDSAIIASERGKGIFRMLCMKALSEINDTLVFNTPNQMSYPAYMKMGWTDVGGLVRIWQSLDLPAMLKYVIKKYWALPSGKIEDVIAHLKNCPYISDEIPEEAEMLIELSENSMSDKIVIKKCRDWIKWRTNTPDGTQFMAYSSKNRFAVIFYVIQVDNFIGVRILDVIADFYDDKIIHMETKRFINIVKKKCDFISMICSDQHPILNYLRRFFPVRKEPVHFVVNTSRLQSADGKDFLNPENWELMQSALDYN